MDKRYLMLRDALDGTPRDLRRLLRPVAPEHAAARHSAGLSMLDVLDAFAVTEPFARAQFERILAEDHPLLPALPAHLREHESVDAAIEAFTAERARTTALLAGLTQQDWLRTAALQDHGPLRLRTLVERLVERDNAQLALLVDMRQSLSQ